MSDDDIPAGEPARKLTQKEQLFVDAFLRTRNATASAIQAGLTEKPRSASVLGCRLTRDKKFAHVQAAIEAALGGLKSSIQAQAQPTLDALVQMRGFDPIALFDTKGEFLPWAEIAPEARMCVTEYSLKEFAGGRSIRIKWTNRVAVTATLAKICGMINDRIPEDDSQSEAELDEKLAELYAQLADECFPGDNVPPEVSKMDEEQTREE